MITSIAILAGLCFSELLLVKIALGKLETKEYNYIEFFELHD